MAEFLGKTTKKGFYPVIACRKRDMTGQGADFFFLKNPGRLHHLTLTNGMKRLLEKE